MTGIDISPVAIRVARGRAQANGVEASFVVGNLETNALEPESFDVAWCCTTWSIRSAW